MSKGLSTLADMRREEQYKSLMEMSDRDLCEMIRAHFESHPTLPGEKALKDDINHRLEQMNQPPENIMEMTDTKATYFGQEAEKKSAAWEYAKTRIRETSLKEGNQYLDFHTYDPSLLRREVVDELLQNDRPSLTVQRTNVELQKNSAGEVYVLAEQSDGTHRTIGTLPENFLKNNPMNVESCEAELQVTDYSNGKFKNVSMCVVVDTDLMSGDVLDLDDTMLAGLNQDSGLER